MFLYKPNPSPVSSRYLEDCGEDKLLIHVYLEDNGHYHYLYPYSNIANLTHGYTFDQSARGQNYLI